MKRIEKSENIKNAFALKYPEGAQAPFITAKGKGELAEKIINVAKENHIEIAEKPELIDFFDACDIGECVPEETWEILAGIFSFILNSREK